MGVFLFLCVFSQKSNSMKKTVLYLLICLTILPGCGAVKNMSTEDRAGFGAQVGSFIGWLFGGLIGDAIDDEVGADIGSFIGTAVGGVAGATIAANAGETESHIYRSPGKYTPSSHVLLPDLMIEDILLLEDSTSFNRKIDAGETCYLSFVISNNSFQDAVNVTPVVKIKKGKHLKITDPVRIDNVSRGNPVTYEVAVYASHKLKTGEAVFSIKLEEGRGNGTEEEVFTVETLGEEDKEKGQ